MDQIKLPKPKIGFVEHEICEKIVEEAEYVDPDLL